MSENVPAWASKATDLLVTHGSPRTIRATGVLLSTVAAYYGVSYLDGDIEKLLNLILLVPFIAATAVMTTGIFRG